MSGLPKTCLPTLEVAADLTGSGFDCVVVVLPSFKYAKNAAKMAAIEAFLPPQLKTFVNEVKDLDAAAANCVTLHQVRCPKLGPREDLDAVAANCPTPHQV